MLTDSYLIVKSCIVVNGFDEQFRFVALPFLGALNGVLVPMCQWCAENVVVVQFEMGPA
jgi:hypothetical protein